MAKQKNIYLLITDGGGGHRNAAEAIRQCFADTPMVNCHIISVLKTITKDPEGLYNVLQKHDLSWLIWPVLVPLFRLKGFFTTWLYRRQFTAFWRKHRPDLVVSLFPLYNRYIRESLRLVHPQIPFFIQITDLAETGKDFWLADCDRLLCPNQHCYQQALAFGLKSQQLQLLSGLIMREQFYQPINESRADLRRQLGLQAKMTTLLISYGAQGNNKAYHLLRAIKRTDIQVIVICGKNTALQTKLKQANFAFNITVLGYRDDMQRWLAASDIFIGKPGPGSIIEALTMGVIPLLECNWRTVRQEINNANWVSNANYGLVFKNLASFIKQLDQVLQAEQQQQFLQNIGQMPNNHALAQTKAIYLAACGLSTKPTVERE